MNRLNRYEVLFIASPEITADESAQVEKQLDKIIKDFQGIFISLDRWGKYHLAYPIRKNDYGVYFLLRFEVAAKSSKDLLQAINDLFTIKNADLIMRHIVSTLDPKKSLEYQRPQSLEEAPVREVDSFLKDTKMSGLEKNVDVSVSELTDEDKNIEL